MKKDKNLTEEEQAIIDSVERGEWKSRPKIETKKAVAAAKEFMKSQRKEAKVNLRLNEMDVMIVREKAKVSGMPYQTLLASVIHKFATDQFVERIVVDELKDLIKKERKAS